MVLPLIMEEQLTFARLCEILGKAPFYITNLQRSLGVYVPLSEVGYSVAYVSFMEKVVALRTFNVPTSDIADVFTKEKRILELLKFDSLSTSPTWYLDACGRPNRSDEHLLLTGHALGFALHASAIQVNLFRRGRLRGTVRPLGEALRGQRTSRSTVAKRNAPR